MEQHSPFAPVEQAEGYQIMLKKLEHQLNVITGFQGTTLQPNSGAQGEYAGLMAIRAYHQSRGDNHRNVCLIPASAHGTNPASAAMAGMEIIVTKTMDNGNIDVEDLRAKAIQHKDNLSALMVTYPSTHGVFESAIIEITNIIHENGGLVYMDGANMNAQVGLTNPATIGADVCHLNLHKTFAIPSRWWWTWCWTNLCERKISSILTIQSNYSNRRKSSYHGYFFCSLWLGFSLFDFLRLHCYDGC